jgi:hypothetical protein
MGMSTRMYVLPPDHIYFAVQDSNTQQLLDVRDGACVCAVDPDVAVVLFALTALIQTLLTT